jgi:hypothetical protein
MVGEEMKGCCKGRKNLNSYGRPKKLKDGKK